jgi:hypothetical protein
MAIIVLAGRRPSSLMLRETRETINHPITPTRNAQRDA